MKIVYACNITTVTTFCKAKPTKHYLEDFITPREYSDDVPGWEGNVKKKSHPRNINKLNREQVGFVKRIPEARATHVASICSMPPVDWENINLYIFSTARGCLYTVCTYATIIHSSAAMSFDCSPGTPHRM
jgi:hypothetical protein